MTTRTDQCCWRRRRTTAAAAVSFPWIWILLLPSSFAAANTHGGTMSSIQGRQQPPPPPPPPMEKYSTTHPQQQQIFHDHNPQAAIHRKNAVGNRFRWMLSSSTNSPRISMVELDGQLQLELEPRSAWREQVEQSLFEQSHIYNIGAQQSEMHQDMYQDIPFVDTFRIPNAQGEEKDQESIASDPQKDDPWKHKVEESLWQLHQKWMELSTILQEEYRRIDASIILPNIDEDLHHHTGLESEVVVVAVEEEPSAQAPPNDDIPFEDMLESSSSIAKDNMEPVLVHDDEARFLHHFLFSWLALSILRDQHDAPKTRIPRMVRRKVTKTRSLPRRTLLSDLEDWDLNDDEFDLLLMDLKLPSMVEEEYSVYEYDAMEEMGDDLELSLPLDILEQETYTPVTDDDEETNAFLKASSAPESWHVVFGELEENEFDSCCDDDPETNVAADYHGESSDDDWANPDEVAQVVLSRDADHQNSPIDTESSMYIGTARRRPPPPPLEDEDDDFFNDLEKQLLEETGAHIEIELDGGRPEYEDEDDMDEEDWRVLQTSATSDGFEDSFALFGEDEDLDRFNVDDEWTEVDPFDEESIAIVPVEEEEEMSLGESASTHPPLPVLQTNFGYPPSLVPPPPSWVAPHSLRTDKLNPEEMRQAPFMRMPQSRNTFLQPLQRPPPPSSILPPPPATRRLPPPPPLFSTSARPPIAAGIPPPPPEQRRQTTSTTL